MRPGDGLLCISTSTGCLVGDDIMACDHEPVDFRRMLRLSYPPPPMLERCDVAYIGEAVPVSGE
jgi:hypothetical protein